MVGMAHYLICLSMLCYVTTKVSGCMYCTTWSQTLLTALKLVSSCCHEICVTRNSKIGWTQEWNLSMLKSEIHTSHVSRLWWNAFLLDGNGLPVVASGCQLCCNFKAQLMVLYSTKINDDALSTFFFHPSSQHCHAVQCAMHSWTVGKRLNPYIHCYLTSLSTLTVLEKNGLSTLFYFPLC